MSRTRVMLVDDSPAVRQIVAEAIAGEPSLELVAQAGNGAIALQRLAMYRPDLIALDVDMPVMNGLVFLRELQRHASRPHVIMFSSYTREGARVTLEALDAGAADFVTKPAGTLGRAAALQQVRDELLPRIRAIMSGVPPAPHDAPAGPIVAEPPPMLSRSALERARARDQAAPENRQPAHPTGSRSQRPRTEAPTVQVVAIAASTGGPPAVKQVLDALPADFPVPVVIVQHMPALFTGPFAERLDATCALEVREAQAGERLVRGQVRVAPGDFHMEITNRMTHRVELHQSPLVNGVRPSADILLHSLARNHGTGVLAVVLTGMGHDALSGCEAVHAAGGQVLVQDRRTSVVWGMPRAIEEAGLADDVLPLGGIAQAIVERVQVGR
ncbi:MAG: chemotaxis response regulator protein-glutamate methylesterase [Candidatus Eisenbacteria bacterium]